MSAGCCPHHLLYPGPGACRFGRQPRVQIENLGQITTELWAAEATAQTEPGLARLFALVLDRHGVTAEEYEAELNARLSPYSAYCLNPHPSRVLEYHRA
jgi:hypothetical protein